MFVCYIVCCIVDVRQMEAKTSISGIQRILRFSVIFNKIFFSLTLRFDLN